MLILSSCSRPPAPPLQANKLLPWGSVDLDITKDKGPFVLKNSLGKALAYKSKHSHTKTTDFTVLAISGGGSQGAYGCGVLDGWKKRGDMPQFDVVTGISTGAIISSFVFLGGENIHNIAQIYLSIETSDIYHYNFFKIFGGSSITSTQPLKDMIAKYITPQVLDAVAQEYKKGRRLYVGTTNIDNGSLVVWDLGAIAASNHPDKLQLYRDIIYASSAIPGIFDPQYFSIKYKNKEYYQMHIDGGMSAYVFMIGMYKDWQKILHLPKETKLNLSLYILSNRQYRYKKQNTPLPNDSYITILTAVAKHSIDLIYDKSIYRLNEACKQNGYNFYYTGIDDDIKLTKLPHQFNKKEMQRLYDQGYKKGYNGVNWQREISVDELLKHN